jgi:PilZ domain
MQTPTATDTGEHRSHPRFPLWSGVRLQGGIGEPPIEATLVDVSAGGALLKLACEVEFGGHRRMLFTAAGEERAIAYEVLATEVSWEGTLLHVAFKGVTAEQDAHLGRLLADLRSGSTDMQRWIASGHGLLGRVQQHANRRVYIP